MRFRRSGIGTDEMWRKVEIAIFDVNRVYEELVDVLHIERVEQYDDLPCDDETGIADDDGDEDLMTYLILSNNPKADLTIYDSTRYMILVLMDYC